MDRGGGSVVSVVENCHVEKWVLRRRDLNNLCSSCSRVKV